ncbi:MAG: sulfite exporter TauE/SafE family protein [Erysipelothrix sp.]|jgi:sulfite exporter TauE/SafE/copper chaperone CopZ|nr:sulfite exporter TauE/SafE family protein [Erysipelothrix sp.]
MFQCVKTIYQYLGGINLDNLVRIVLNVDGMTCVGCENKIQSKLKKTDGVISVKASYANGTVKITFDRTITTLKKLKRLISLMDYIVVESSTTKNKPKENTLEKIVDAITIGVIILVLYHFAQRFGLLNVFNSFPEAQQGMSYGVLFIIGLFTSVHCVAMCGGINLSQCIPQHRSIPQNGVDNLMPSFLYNSGRVVSYTIIGGLVGALGSVVSFSGAAKGIVAIIAGVFMLIMGVNMLNIFPWLRKFNPRLPRFLGKIVNSEKNRYSSRFYVGLLNGLMPCGPLQAMQLYALSTGDPIKGALSMFFFSIGTVPLMFGLGALSSLLSKAFNAKMIQVSAVLVVILGFAMFQTGLGVSGIQLPSISTVLGFSKDIDNVAVVESDGIQRVTSGITSDSYESISLKANVPAQWTIHVDAGDLNGCNYRIISQNLGIRVELVEGDNVIEVTPKRKGTYTFTCWMGMIRSYIIVN